MDRVQHLREHLAHLHRAARKRYALESVSYTHLAIALLSHIEEQRTCAYDENSDKENIDDDLLHGSSYEVLPVAWRPAR